MGENRESSKRERPLDLAEERGLGEVIRNAGPRPEVPEEDLAEIKAAFRAEWREKVAASSEAAVPARRRFALPLAAALVAASLGVAAWLLVGRAPAPVEIATVETLEGDLSWRPADDETGAGVRLAVGESLPRGALLVSAPERGVAGLELSSGITVRVDHGTRVRLTSASRLELEAGALYVDTHGAEPGAGIEVRTPLGVARDIGTQFELRLLDGEGGRASLRLRVREGEVAVEAGGETISALAREELVLGPGGSVARSTVEPHATEWGWARGAAPPLAIAGLPAREVVDMVAREHGWKVRFASGPARDAAEGLLQGPRAELPLDEALLLALGAVGLEHEVVEGELRIRRLAP